MKRVRHTPERVINKLREAETMLAGGRTVAQVLQHLGVSEATFNRWRNQYGGMKSDEALATMQAGLQSREPDHRDEFIHQSLASGFGPRSASRPWLLRFPKAVSANGRSTSGRPASALRSGAVEMSRSTSPSAKKP